MGTWKIATSNQEVITLTSTPVNFPVVPNVIYTCEMLTDTENFLFAFSIPQEISNEVEWIYACSNMPGSTSGNSRFVRIMIGNSTSNKGTAKVEAPSGVTVKVHMPTSIDLI